MPAQPLRPEGRIDFLDILRGIAILFIFVANIYYFSGVIVLSPEELAQFSTVSIDRILHYLEQVLVDGKFYSLFSLLFGIGFVVQYNKLSNSGGKFVPFFTRRMLGLTFIGGIHLFLIWPGDILTLYALLGFVLIAFRTASNRSLLIWAVILLFMPLIHILLMEWTGIFYPSHLIEITNRHSEAQGLALAEPFENGRKFFDFRGYYQLSDFSTWISINPGLPGMRYGNLLFEGRPFKVLAIFLIGIWAGRKIIHNDLLNDTALLKKIFVLGIAIGLPVSALRTYLDFYENQNLLIGISVYLTYAIGVVPLACGYAAGLALLAGRSVKWLAWFAPVGRTALSNYLLQTVIAITFFYGIGFGMSGKLSLSQSYLFVVGVFAVQIVLSSLWLKYFMFGPVEWFWRSLTYGKAIAIKRRSSK